MSGRDSFDSALEGIRRGADYRISGLTLTVDGVTIEITGEQFDIAYDVMDEVDSPGDDKISLPRAALER